MGKPRHPDLQQHADELERFVRLYPANPFSGAAASLAPILRKGNPRRMLDQLVWTTHHCARLYDLFGDKPRVLQAALMATHDTLENMLR